MTTRATAVAQPRCRTHDRFEAFTRVAAFAAVLAAAAFWFPVPPRAQGAPAADPAIARVKAAMEGFVKGRYKVEDVRKTPLPGIYEVRIGHDCSTSTSEASTCSTRAT